MAIKQISVFDVLRGRASASVGVHYSALEVATSKANIFSKVPAQCYVPPPLRQMEDIANVTVPPPITPPRLFIKPQEGFVERNFWIIIILLAILLIILVCLLIKQHRELKKIKDEETRPLSKFDLAA
jgi:hypothetical protein